MKTAVFVVLVVALIDCACAGNTFSTGRKLARPVTADSPDGESPVIRSAQDSLLTVPNRQNVTTMSEMFWHAAKDYPNQVQFGQRTLLGIHKKNITQPGTDHVTVWEYYELSDYNWMTYSDALTLAYDWGNGLRLLGVGAGSKLTIFHHTSREWMLMAHAAFSQNVTISTSYDTLGVDGLAHSMNDGGNEAIFTSCKLLSLIPDVAARVPSLREVIYSPTFECTADEVKATLRAQSSRVNVRSLDQLKQLGQSNGKIETSPPSPDDIACIMYTSGSTGLPKGVVLKHKMLIAALAGAENIFETDLSTSDVYLAYLPLAHILEFMVETNNIYRGIPMGYGSPKTLTDKSTFQCEGDIVQLKPTFMAGVPSVWETIRKGIMAKLGQDPKKLRVFGTAYGLKTWLNRIGWRRNPLLNKLVFSKIQGRLGGKLRFVLSGGAPIPAKTHDFVNTCICPMIQGYGLTETCGIVSVQSIANGIYLVLDALARELNVGAVSPSIEMKLISTDVYDAKGYLPSLTACFRTPPQGELLVRGPSITSGYYNLENATREAIDEDGWFHTGDIVQLDGKGCIKIIDRAKNLVKLRNGEYIAIENLESVYKTSALVQDIMVYADNGSPFAVAVVVPNEAELKLRNIAASLTELESWSQSQSRQLKDLVVQDFAAIAKAGKKAKGDMIKDVVLGTTVWTPENGYLTNAMKLNRKIVKRDFKDAIDAIYKGN